MLRFEKYLFYCLVLLALSLLIIPQYYITGDGPSHTYNAKVLFDYVFNHDRNFYKEFYLINRNLDPNWIGHLMIGFFLQVMPYWLADKLFQIIYVLLFSFGFRYCIQSISKENSFLSFLFFPFLFTLAFQEGFYNYSLAIGLMCWAFGYFIRIKHHLDNPAKQFTLSLLLLITAFSHGMPVMYTILMISLMWLTENFRLFIPFDFRKLSVHLSRLGLLFLPSLLLVFLFLIKRGTGREPHPLSVWQKFINFLTFYSSQSTRHAEIFPATACGILLISFLFVLFFTRIKVNIQTKMGLGFVCLFMLLFTFISYLSCPQSIGGAGSIDIRLAFLPPMFLLFYFATKKWTELAKMVFISASFLISCTFLVIRFPYVVKANEVGKEIMKASDFIQDKSVVLNLHFDYWQQLPGKDSLFHHDGSFLHFSDYLGAVRSKHLILLNNYEAEINYFPVNWVAGKNPRESVPGFIQGQLPPCGDYSLYEKQVYRKIDYIVFQNWRQDALLDPCLKTLVEKINTDFTKVYEGKNRYVIVFKRR
ncbi:hypothetical protein EMGBS15_09060 [Filimonas sp.]|nr:hypothetical protein EMGBS15_09060 [Filimonas sp.]